VALQQWAATLQEDFDYNLELLDGRDVELAQHEEYARKQTEDIARLSAHNQELMRQLLLAQQGMRHLAFAGGSHTLTGKCQSKLIVRQMGFSLGCLFAGLVGYIDPYLHGAHLLPTGLAWITTHSPGPLLPSQPTVVVKAAIHPGHCRR